jgi:protein involved in polysaccharide export with SLBB domain
MLALGAAVIGAGASAAPGALRAQSAKQPGAYSPRAELEAIAAARAAEASDPKRSTSERLEASLGEKQLRERLSAGDFRVGDRIVLRISGATTAIDTASVTPDRSLRIPDAGDVSLDGVLRSELDDRLNAQLARYVRNAVVRAQPLTRLAVLGEVRSPGFVHVPSQSLLSDVISAAGGPTPGGNLDRITVRRSGDVLVDARTFARGLAAGATLDDFGIHAGDEVVVGGKRSFNWAQAAQVSALVIGSAATLIAIQHR